MCVRVWWEGGVKRKRKTVSGPNSVSAKLVRAFYLISITEELISSG